MYIDYVNILQPEIFISKHTICKVKAIRINKITKGACTLKI